MGLGCSPDSEVVCHGCTTPTLDVDADGVYTCRSSSISTYWHSSFPSEVGWAPVVALLSYCTEATGLGGKGGDACHMHLDAETCVISSEPSKKGCCRCELT